MDKAGVICYIGVDGAATVIGLKSHNRERETRFSPPSLNRGKARRMTPETQITLKMPTWFAIALSVGIAVALVRDFATAYQASKAVFVVKELVDENRALRKQQ